MNPLLLVYAIIFLIIVICGLEILLDDPSQHGDP